jgi:hypothetical protein
VLRANLSSPRNVNKVVSRGDNGRLLRYSTGPRGKKKYRLMEHSQTSPDGPLSKDISREGAATISNVSFSRNDGDRRSFFTVKTGCVACSHTSIPPHGNAEG